MIDDNFSKISDVDRKEGKTLQKKENELIPYEITSKEYRRNFYKKIGIDPKEPLFIDGKSLQDITTFMLGEHEYDESGFVTRKGYILTADDVLCEAFISKLENDKYIPPNINSIDSFLRKENFDLDGINGARHLLFQSLSYREHFLQETKDLEVKKNAVGSISFYVNADIQPEICYYDSSETFIKELKEALDTRPGSFKYEVLSDNEALNNEVNKAIHNFYGNTDKESSMPKKNYKNNKDYVKKTPSEKFDEYTKHLADYFLKEIENNTAPWMKPWKAADYTYPRNPSTGTVYSGVNSLYLERVQEQVFKSEDPRWYTFLNIRELQNKNESIKLKQGSKGYPIKFYELLPLDENGKPIKKEDLKNIEPARHRPILKEYFVFHASCIENLPVYEKPKTEAKEFNNIAHIDKFIENTKAEIVNDTKDSAFWSPVDDKIHTPMKENFLSEPDYYSTILHELSHWTGGEKRLNRESVKNYKEQRPLEELNAEIGSYLLCKDLKIDFNPQNTISYVKSWASAIKDKPETILTACKNAEKIKNYLKEFQNTNTHKQENNNTKGKGR